MEKPTKRLLDADLQSENKKRSRTAAPHRLPSGDSGNELHYAICYQSREEVSLLCNQYDANSRTAHGFPAMHLAFLCNRINYVRILLAHGADPDAKNHADRTLLEVSIDTFNKDMVVLLLTYGACYNNLNNDRLIMMEQILGQFLRKIVCEKNYKIKTRNCSLVPHKATVHELYEALLIAAGAGNLSMVNALINEYQFPTYRALQIVQTILQRLLASQNHDRLSDYREIHSLLTNGYSDSLKEPKTYTSWLPNSLFNLVLSFRLGMKVMTLS